jgi:hypothetical protein
MRSSLRSSRGSDPPSPANALERVKTNQFEPWARLPLVCQVEILSFLTLPEILECFVVSTGMRTTAMNDELWHILYARGWPNSTIPPPVSNCYHCYLDRVARPEAGDEVQVGEMPAPVTFNRHDCALQVKWEGAFNLVSDAEVTNYHVRRVVTLSSFCMLRSCPSALAGLRLVVCDGGAAQPGGQHVQNQLPSRACASQHQAVVVTHTCV